MQVALLVALILGIVHVLVSGYYLSRNPPQLGFYVFILVTLGVLVCNAYQADREEDTGALAAEVLAALVAYGVLIIVLVGWEVKYWNSSPNENRHKSWMSVLEDLNKFLNIFLNTDLLHSESKMWSPSRVSMTGVLLYTVLTLIAFIRTR